jgi:hypothetical protein
MPRQRSPIAGCTDYTGVSIEDITEHISQWIENLVDDLSRLDKELANVACHEHHDRCLAQEGLYYIEHFKDLFKRYCNDLTLLKKELPKGVQPRHLVIAQQLYQSVKSEDRYCAHFKMANSLDGFAPSDNLRKLLASVYAFTRDSVIDLRDLSNIASRLEALEGISSITENVSQTAMNALELKPNFFGIGLNLNYIWDKWIAPNGRKLSGIALSPVRLLRRK